MGKKTMKSKGNASRSGGLTKQFERANLAGGKRGRGRPRSARSRPSDGPLLSRLRRLEIVLLSLMHHKSVRSVTDPELRAMLDQIGDGWNQSGREAVGLSKGREGEGDLHTDVRGGSEVPPDADEPASKLAEQLGAWKKLDSEEEAS